MRKIKFGIIGLGAMGKGHLNGLSSLEEAEIVALADPHKENIEKAKEKLKTSPHTFKDYKDLLSLKEIEAVIVATPNYTHKEITIASFKAGKHVLCEKPMATTLKDCEAMIETSEESGKILQIGLELRYAEIYQKMKEIISRGDIGQVQMIWCKEFRVPFRKKVEDWILKEKLSGGSLVEKDCHHFDIFNWMIDSKPLKVVAFGGQNVEYKDKGRYVTGKDKGTEVTVIDNAWVIVEYENGARASLGLCLFSPYGNDLEIGAIGDRGKLESYWKENKIVTFDAEKPDETTYTFGGLPKEGHGGAEVNEQKAFLNCLKSNKKPFVDGKIGKDSVAVALAAERSIKENRIVSIKELL